MRVYMGDSMKEGPKAGIFHVIDNPLFSEACRGWGEGLTTDNRSYYCDESPGDELVRLLGKRQDVLNRVDISYVG